MANAFDGAPVDAADKSLHRHRLKMTGYGMGIPLCQHYANFFGGGLFFSSIYGYGTDVSIRLNRFPSIGARAKAESSLLEEASPVPSRRQNANLLFDIELGGEAD